MRPRAPWRFVCELDEILPDAGVAALLDGRQIAIFRIGNQVYALDNYDPNSAANVLARGLIGDVRGEPVVTSPVYKQHFSLATGRCLQDATKSVRTYAARVSDGKVWVKSEPMRALARPRKLVVVGNGMAGTKVVEQLLELAPNAYEVTVFGEEPHPNYNRILLSPLLAGEKRIDDIILNPFEWYRAKGVRLHAGDPIALIDRKRRRVRSASGLEADYDRLVLATGSRPVILPVPGAGLPGVVAFRDLEDVDAMLEAARLHTKAVVIGGGLLGLEAASGLMKQGMDVTVVHLFDTLMERQLDRAAAALLRDSLEKRGLKFQMPARTVAILDDEVNGGQRTANGPREADSGSRIAESQSAQCAPRHPTSPGGEVARSAGEGTAHAANRDRQAAPRVRGVRFEDGSELEADLVVMAAGIRPNIELALAAGLRCDRGVLVNDTMQTFDPCIYAVGECVQHRNTTYGLVAPLLEQANVCATHLAEFGIGRYRGSLVATQLKVTGVDVFSAGDFVGGPRSESLVLRDARRGVYKRIVIEDNRVRGAVLYGDVKDGPWYLDLMKQAHDIAALRDKLLFGAAYAA